MTGPVVAHDDRATGVFGTAFGFTVFLIFLLFTVQLLFGLYARTTVTAVAADVVQEAANEGPASAGTGRAAFYEDETKRRLGDYGDRAEVDLSVLDADADGIDDTIALTVDAELPTLLPDRWIPFSPRRFSRTMRARLEVFQESP